MDDGVLLDLMQKKESIQQRDLGRCYGPLGDLPRTWPVVKDILQYLSQTVLPGIAQCLAVDDQSALCDQAIGICSDCLHAIELLIDSANEGGVAERLEAMRPLLGVLSLCQLTAAECLNHVVKWKPDGEAHLELIGKPLMLALKLAKQGLCHCQESGASYGPLFSALETELLDVFMQSYNSLKVCFSHLEQLSVQRNKSEDFLRQVWTCLRDVAAVSVHFDSTLMVKSWRHFLKFYSKLGSDVKDSLELQTSLAVLAETLVDRLRGCVSSLVADQSAKGSPAKVVTFLSNALTSLLQSCSALDDDAYLMLLDMVLRTNSCVTVLHRIKVTDDPSCAALLTAVKQLTSSVLTRLAESWPEILPSLVELANGEDREKLVGVHLCTLWFFQNLAELPAAVRDQLIVAACSPEQVESSQFPLLELLFQALPHCQVEFSLGSGFGAACGSASENGSSTSSLHHSSLYQHTFDVVCTFAVSLSSREYMACLEWGLLQQVMESWHPLCVLLSRDLFVFLSRLGTSSLRVSYVLFLVKLIHSLPASCNTGYRNLLSLTRSLFSTLTEKESSVALDRLSAVSSENLSVLWSLLDFSTLSETKLMQLVPGIIMPAVKHLTFWQQQTTSNPAEVIRVLEVVSNVSRDLRCFQAMPPGQRLALGQLVLLLWRRMIGHVCEVDTLTMESSTACHVLLEWSSLMVPIMSIEEVKTLLLLYQDHLLACSHVDIVAGLPAVISAWAGRTIPDDQQEELLGIMGSLCGACLSSNSWIVHQNALVAFTAFAKSTPYDDAVESKFMPPDLSEVIVAYLQKVPRDATLVGDGNVERLQSVLKERQYVLMERRQLLEMTTEPSKYLMLKAALHSLNANLDTVSRFLDATGDALPEWLPPQLNTAHTTTKLLMDKVSSIAECAAVGSQLMLDDVEGDN